MEDVIKYGAQTGLQGAGAEFQMLLNKAPAKSEIKSQTLAGKNVNYIPIGQIEKTLDELYNGLWQISEIRHALTLNSITVELILEVFHPQARLWLKRAGVGAIKVQLNQGATALDVTQIKADAIQKGLPAAKAMAVKNAAQSLGVVFGRDLNRDTNDEFVYLSEQAGTLEEVGIEALRLLDGLTLPDGEREQYKKAITGGNLKKVQAIVEFLKKKGAQQ